MATILFVLSGADHWTLADGSPHPTGFWAEEMVAPYQVFAAAGHRIAVATPHGTVPTVDQASLTPEMNGGEDGAAAMRRDLADIPELTSPLRLEEVQLDDYDAVFYPGGHGPMEDLAVNTDSGRLLTATLHSGKPLGVVCHAPAAMLAAEDADGTSPFAGYRMTGFSNAEETQVGLAERAAWLLQDRLIGMGADYREGEPWAVHIVVDRNLHTGQNPASSAPLATELLKALD